MLLAMRTLSRTVYAYIFFTHLTMYQYVFRAKFGGVLCACVVVAGAVRTVRCVRSSRC